MDLNTINAVAAVCSALAALAALIVGRLMLKAQIKHNELSVKPLPFIAVADYENRIWVKLVNNGSGPLIVRSSTVFCPTKTHKTVIEHMPILPKGLFWRTFTSGLENRSILPGGELFFIDLEGSIGEKVFVSYRDQCRKALSKLELSIEYTDIYGTNFSAVTRKLEWFSR